MKRIKKLNGWGIYENNPKEIAEFGFEFTVLHPDNVEYSYMCTPRDSDMECSTLEQAESWINHY